MRDSAPYIGCDGSLFISWIWRSSKAANLALAFSEPLRLGVAYLRSFRVLKHDPYRGAEQPSGAPGQVSTGPAGEIGSRTRHVMCVWNPLQVKGEPLDHLIAKPLALFVCHSRSNDC